MAEFWLCQEAVGVTPYQENKAVRRALQHQVIKKENEIQNYSIGDNIGVLDIQPKAPEPNFNQIPSALLREYVLAVANGLQSSDPTTGLFTMIEPLSMGMNRDKALEAVRNGTFQLNFDKARLDLMLDRGVYLSVMELNRLALRGLGLKELEFRLYTKVHNILKIAA
ncbi:hypothetical protein FQR65_LT16747 [Abscondita terminalis]|nr:hypothetical protein FQR65_LT16747 [Abscondita terminalis]